MSIEARKSTLAAAVTPRTLTVLVPALNEEENLRPTVERLLRALTITIEDFEIVIVDDGSDDRTGQVADALAAEHAIIRVIHNPERRGLGHAYLQGITAARKDYFVYIPGDNTWPYRSFVELFGALGKADVITSYSTNPGVRPGIRRLVSRAYTFTLNILFLYRLQYYNGLTIYPLTFLRTGPITTSGFGFQAEALIKAIEAGYSYIEAALPIDERTAGASKAVNVRNILSVAVTVLRLFWRVRVLGHGRARKGPSRGKAAGTGRPSRPLNIVITGASSGIGAELVKALSAEGHAIFAAARNEQNLSEVSKDGTIAKFKACDVTSEDDVRKLVAAVEKEFKSIDVLMNCAGNLGAIGPVEATDSKEWLQTITVNLYGPYLTVKHFLPLLARAERPRVLNFSGGGAFAPFPNYSAYACSKAAIVRFTECMAAELAPRGISVNAIAPGFIATAAHQATMVAGKEKAGTLQFRRTQALLNEAPRIDNVIECIRVLLQPDLDSLTGKTVSVNFDPWRTDAFRQHIEEITRSDLYSMRRINIVNLPEGKMRADLSEAWASFGTHQ